MKALVTGSTSVIGKSLVAILKDRGWTVVRTQHSDPSLPFYFSQTSDPDEKAPPRELRDIDTIISIAWDRRAGLKKLNQPNLRGVRTLVGWASSTGARLVFLSSDSAEVNQSHYGTEKRAAELLILNYKKGRVLRAGIVTSVTPTPIQKHIGRLNSFPGICLHLSPDPLLRISPLPELVDELASLAEGSPPKDALGNRVPLSHLSHELQEKKPFVHLRVPWKIPFNLSRFAEFLGLSGFPHSDSFSILRPP